MYKPNGALAREISFAITVLEYLTDFSDPPANFSLTSSGISRVIQSIESMTIDVNRYQLKDCY